MTKYWIFDRDETPQGFPLVQLITKIREVAGASDCQFLVRRCQGYGATVYDWAELLDEVEEITVSPEELERLGAGTEEWFYDIDARCVTPTESIAFGIHDSAALFLDASASLVPQILDGFRDVRAAKE